MAEETAGTEQTTLTSGSRIIGGAYEVERLIKAGGMGEVYRGKNVQTGRNVAIKIILTSLARDETYMALFEREALILEELAHEAIVRYQLYAVDQTTGRPCLIMQFVPGPSLKERMEQGPMSSDEIRVLTKRLASGLRAAHDHKYKVFHRDLSPDNVILEDGRVELAKLIDFGIAKGGVQETEKSVLAGKIAGKYNYMAPEQLGLYQMEIDARTDIYSLGLIILGLFRGQVVDMGKTIGEAVLRRQSIPDLSAASPEMASLLQQMLNPDPKQRPDNMGAVLDLLERSQPLLPRSLADHTIVTPKPPPSNQPPRNPATSTPDAALTQAQMPNSSVGLDMDATVVKPLPPTGPRWDQPATAGSGFNRTDQKPFDSTDDKTDFYALSIPPKPDFRDAALAAPAFPSSDFAVGGFSEFSDIGKPTGNPSPSMGPPVIRPGKSTAKPAVAAQPRNGSGKMLAALLGTALLVVGAGLGYYFLAAPTPQQSAKIAAPVPKVPTVDNPTPITPTPLAPAPPAPTVEDIRKAALDQVDTTRAGRLGTCTFVRLRDGLTADQMALRSVAQSATFARSAIDNIILPDKIALPAILSGFADDSLCAVIELANLMDATTSSHRIDLRTDGLTDGMVKAGTTEIAGRVAGASINTVLYLIRGETGWVTPLPLAADGSYSIHLTPGEGTAADKMLLALDTRNKVRDFDLIKDGLTAESAMKVLAYGLKQGGQTASIDLIPFRLAR